MFAVKLDPVWLLQRSSDFHRQDNGWIDLGQASRGTKVIPDGRH